ncbi:MAG: hypothetical protein ACK5ZG_04545 [Phycisphaerae bacterium]|jgi:hypothetical protein
MNRIFHRCRAALRPLYARSLFTQFVCDAGQAAPVEQLETREHLAFVSQPTITIDAPLIAAITADLNGDGVADIAGLTATNAARSALTIALATSPTFAPSVTNNDDTANSNESFTPLHAGDLDGDGDIDMLHASGTTWLNDGTGAFTLGPSLGEPITRVGFAVGNFVNGAGDEVFEAVRELSNTAHTVRVLRIENGVWTTLSTATFNLSQLDIDGVGRFDREATTQQVLARTSNASIATTYNSALSIFSVTDTLSVQKRDVSSLPVNLQRPDQLQFTDAYAIDFNDDGWTDIISLVTPPSAPQILPVGAATANSRTVLSIYTNAPNAPQGFFSNAVSQITGTQMARIEAIADVTGNGLLDVLGSATQFRIANGLSVFSDVHFLFAGDRPNSFDSSTYARLASPGSTQDFTTLAIINNNAGPAEIIQRRGDATAVSSITQGGARATALDFSPIVVGDDIIEFRGLGISSLDNTPISSARIVVDSNNSGFFDAFDEEYLTLTLQPDGSTALGTKIVPSAQTVGTKRYFLVASTALGENAVQTVSISTWARNYYPEGFKNININETIWLSNTSLQTVNYRIILRYSDGQRDQVLAWRLLPVSASTQISTSVRGDLSATPVRPNTPYAIEIQSSLPITASLTRSDNFGRSNNTSIAGESFTPQAVATSVLTGISTRTLDFVTFYNPSESPTNVTITAYEGNGRLAGEVVLDGVVNGRRRDGALASELLRDVMNRLGVGELNDITLVVRSDADKPLVVNLSSHDLANRRSAMTLAEPFGISFTYRSVFPALELRDRTQTTLTLANITGQGGVVNLLITAQNGATRTHTVTLQPYRATTIDIRAFAPRNARVVTVEASSSPGLFVPVNPNVPPPIPFVASLDVIDRARRDRSVISPVPADITARFADGQLTTDRQGRRSIATLNVHNPGSEPLTLTVDYIFSSGFRRTSSYTIEPRRPRIIDLSRDARLAAGLPAGGPFGLQIWGSGLFQASFYRADPGQGQWLTTTRPLSAG